MLVPFVLMTCVLRARAVQVVVLCVTCGVTLCAGDVCAENGADGGFMLQVVLPFVLVTCVLRVVVQVVVSCVTSGVTFCAGDLCAESSIGGGFMCYRWCYRLCW